MQNKPVIPFATLLKTMMVVSAPSLLVLVFFAAAGVLDFNYFFYGYLIVIAMSSVFVLPFLSNISALTHYVEDLSLDKRVQAPNLSVLSNVGELSGSLSRLQRSWENKRQEMETVITEREILVDTLPDILIMTNDDKMIVRTNRAARSIFGQNLAHRHLREIIPSEKLMNAITAVIEDLRGQQVEFHLAGDVPRDFHAIIERFPIPSEGGISIVITLTDITQQKHIQSMRADFVANASHEIRTPLASIIGFIETLQGPAKDDPAARDEFLRVMGEQAGRMSKLINDLLSLSKIEMNAHTSPTAKVDLLRIIRSEKQHFEWVAKQKNVTLRMKLNDNLPPTRGDDEELGQVIQNLIGNAIKYTGSDTEVVITARLTSSLPSDNNFRSLTRAICFSVQDEGEGIAKEHIPRLTERFYRVDTARTRKVGGTGLGLAIVKHVLNRHHGSLVIESEVGKGSVFSVYLPVYDDVAPAGAEVKKDKA
ncbi:MAG: PAS domain-containing protein [Alphaproteobacteria bacterium]|nr:PAS domain-containing protein [Alphaproteobacteria bacterium]